MAMVMAVLPGVRAQEQVFTILAASDFQERGDTYAQADANGAANVTAIVRQVTQRHNVDAFLFGGDYSLTMGNAAVTTDGYHALLGALNGAGLRNADKVFIQGNHEPAGLSFITPTGGYDKGRYALYVLNEDDYNYGTQNQASVQAQANALESWLARQNVGEKPIFVLSHVPLHYSMRTRNGGDAQYAKYLVDVLNAAGQRGLNIIFLFGHNHSGGYDSYLGGATNFIPHGGRLWVCDPAGTALEPKAHTINFTYMNSGYVGYYEGIAGSDAVRTMAVFEIRGDEVTIRRYDANGEHGVKPCPGVWANSAEPGYGYTTDTAVYPGSTAVFGSSVEVKAAQILGTNRFCEGNAAAVSIPVEAGVSYRWISEDPAVATVIPGSNGSATICAVSAGSTRICVYREGETTPLADLWIMVSGEVAVDSSGVFYKLVNSLTEGRNYIFADSDKEGRATILMAAGSGTGLAMTDVTIGVYNSGIPHIRQPEDLNHKRWTFQNVNAQGYGELKAHERTSMLGFRGVSNSGQVHWGKAEALKASHAPDTLLWTYNAQEGLRSSAVDYAGWSVKLTHFVHNGWGENYWAAVGRHLDPVYFARMYAYEETPLTAMAELSDKNGSVGVGAAGDARTGTMIVKTWTNGQVEYIPVTMDMLSGVDTAVAGTYPGLSVIYNDVLLTSSYTLTVEQPGEPEEQGYYYRLTDGFQTSPTFNGEHRYLILNRNTAGTGKLMMAQGYDGRHVVSVDVTVRLDGDGVPCVMPEDLNGEPVFQEWWYHQHYDNQWYLWQPNWTGSPNNYLRIAAVGGGNVVTGDLDIHALRAPVIGSSTSLERYTTVRGSLPVANNATIYLQYRPADDQFVGVTAADRIQGGEVYVYERVSLPSAD
jgi:hypothetical protein